MSSNTKSDSLSMNPNKDLTEKKNKEKDIQQKSDQMEGNTKDREDREQTDQRADSSLSVALPADSPIQTSPAGSGQRSRSSTESNASVPAIGSVMYLRILDKYVTGKHWDLGIEYNLNAVSLILWSLLLNYFITMEISDDCRHERYFLMTLSALLSALNAIEALVVCIIWYSKPIYNLISRSKLCLTVLVVHIIMGTTNLCIAIVCLGSKTCFQLNRLDPTLEHILPVKYELKTMAIIHLIVSVNFFVCAMLLAIKRNDFKFYVLWRKGLLNEYLLVQEDD